MHPNRNRLPIKVRCADTEAQPIGQQYDLIHPHSVPYQARTDIAGWRENERKEKEEKGEGRRGRQSLQRPPEGHCARCRAGGGPVRRGERRRKERKCERETEEERKGEGQRASGGHQRAAAPTGGLEEADRNRGGSLVSLFSFGYRMKSTVPLLTSPDISKKKKKKNRGFHPYFNQPPLTVQRVQQPSNGLAETPKALSPSPLSFPLYISLVFSFLLPPLSLPALQRAQRSQQASKGSLSPPLPLLPSPSVSLPLSPSPSPILASVLFQTSETSWSATDMVRHAPNGAMILQSLLRTLFSLPIVLPPKLGHYGSVPGNTK